MAQAKRKGTDVGGVLPRVLGKTEPPTPAGAGAPERVPATGRTIAVGVGLKTSEVDDLNHIASETDTSRNALMRIAVRRFLEDYRAGRVDLADYMEVRTIKKLRT